MENTLGGAAGASLGEQSAVQNAKDAAAFKLVLVWLAVGVPMLWGMTKALGDVPALISLFH